MPKSTGPSPQELRKIEKDRRRKQYEDIQVQGTNNSSIVSKRSVEMIYQSVCPPGEWFKHFVPKGKRRSPAINRGYWIRMESIRSMIIRIMESEPQKPVNVINLGCGYDPLPFQMLSMGHNMTFYDIDYPDLVKNKHDMILKSKEIQDLVGPDAGGLGLMNCDKYKLIGCDLKNHEVYKDQMKKLKPGVNIFIAEVSLAYMHFTDANKIIGYSSEVPNSHFLILEQILPAGTKEAFATKMLNHFSKLRSSLKCVEEYPLIEHQISRFQQYYKHVEVKNLFENWNDLIDETTKQKVDEVESFDEWEEFILFCQHYVVLHATNDSLVYKQPNVSLQSRPVVELNIKPDTKSLDLKYPASCVVGGSIYVNGGLGQTRSIKTYKDSEELETLDPPSGRMCHTFTDGILVGGRTQPGSFLKDVYRFNAKEAKWSRLEDLPVGVSRHSAVSVDTERILIIGGQSQKGSMILYNHKTQTSKLLQCSSEIDFSTIASFGCDFDVDQQVGYIIGGQTNKQSPRFSNKLFKFWLENDEFKHKMVMEDAEFERMDCKLVKYNETLVVVGGINYNQILGQDNIIVKVSVCGKKVVYGRIPDRVWKNHSPLMIGHNVVIHDNQIKVLNGGVK
ncbi:tRNA methyltransferase ppm2 [Yamadazyma tenuis]|uniref:tRNA methyltransferase ppm2 n=1 Tax=Candida tenuis TaxID=2315449 RepID=UPI0027A57EF8|nr:tRNA methyltransferase ppm2 [Yamadazyma tenuis]